MTTVPIALSRLAWAGLAAGAWIFASGLAMAAVFGYREMSAAFARIGLVPPTGAGTFAAHTLVRLGLGFAVAVLFVLALDRFPRGQAALVAAALVWVLASLFPFLVMTEWGLFSWRLAWKVWGWSAAELVVAARIAALVYGRS